MLLPRRFLLSFVCTASVGFLLYLVSALHISPFLCIFVQTLCDTGICILNVRCSSFHSFLLFSIEKEQIGKRLSALGVGNKSLNFNCPAEDIAEVFVYVVLGAALHVVRVAYHLYA